MRLMLCVAIVEIKPEMKNDRCYTELCKLNTFQERLNYLRLDGVVGKETFSCNRYLNQDFYRSIEWHHIRNQVIIRDMGCDLGMKDYYIQGRVIIHHMNPLTEKDILQHNIYLTDPEYLITVSHLTHNAIHYGNTDCLITSPTIRTVNDTCPWKKQKG